MFAELTTHDLSHSSEPTGSAPTCQPVATGPAKTADEALLILADECNALADQEEAMHSARGVYNTTSAEFEAAGKAIEPISDLLSIKWATAHIVRPDTHVGLAAKARIYHSMRHALAGCVVEEAQPLLESIVEDVARLSGNRPQELWAKADATLIRTAAEAIRLSAESDAIWGSGPELRSDDPRQTAWHEKAKEASARYNTCIATLAAMKPVTPAGMAAKASVAPYLTRFQDEMRSTPEADLMASIAADALRLGAGMPVSTDAELLALGAQLDHLWAEEEAAASQDDAAVDAAIDRSRAVVDAIMALQPTTLAGVRVKARAVSWGYCNHVSDEAGTGPMLLARFLGDMGALSPVTPSNAGDGPVQNVEVASNTFVPPAALDRTALESYRTWLHLEHRALTQEMYPGYPDAVREVSLDLPGARFHFRGEPPASTRAERILASVGIDWRNDRVAGLDYRHEHEQAA